MPAREQLIQEIEQVSDALVEEVLDFLLFVKARQSRSNPALPNPNSQTSAPSVLERMGGVPQNLLSVGGLSDRDVRRAMIATPEYSSDRNPG